MDSHIRWSGFRPTSPKLAVVVFLLSSFLLSSTLLLTNATHSSAADAAFTQWLAALWPEAQAMGVSRTAFDAATRGLEPDFALPDLALPGRLEAPQPGQAEFVRTPADYLKESTISRLAAQGAKLRQQYRVALDGIEQRFGVPAGVVLAIWGRETDFGNYKLPHSAIRVLATQAYAGKRKDMFRQEFLLALKMMEEGDVRPADLRSSWGGAMGLTQFLPSEFYKHAVDFDGDGHRDIWHSVPDARAPEGFDCTQGVPEVMRPIGDWLKAGFVPAYGRRLRPDELAETVSVLQPEGIYGPAFLTPKNYFVIKEYNFSDLYVLFVGHVSDRIGDPRPFETSWSKGAQMRTADVEAMQKDLTARALYEDKIDGKAGMKTRAALGAYQKANGLKLDCWPTSAVLDHMRAHPAAAAGR